MHFFRPELWFWRRLGLHNVIGQQDKADGLFFVSRRLTANHEVADASSATCYGLKKPSATIVTQRQERQGGLMNSASNLDFDTRTSKSKTLKLEHRSKFKKGDGKQSMDLSRRSIEYSSIG